MAYYKPSDQGVQMAEQVDLQEIERAVERLLKSPEFVGSPRLVGFLRYVFEKTLSGNQQDIKAKTIGLDVYHYSVDEIEDRENVVRVDAGRIRRKLNEYYNGSGASEHVRIVLPKGSYVPTFSGGRAAAPKVPQTEAPKTAGTQEKKNFRMQLIAACGITSLIALVGFAQPWRTSEVIEGTVNANSVFEVSPTRLEAVNLARQGRNMMFPATDPGRLSASLAIFRSAIDSDPDYFGGYAGAAQVLALIAMVGADKDVAKELQVEALKSSQRAVSLAPEASWAISAQAMAEWANDRHAAAQRLSLKASNVDPSDVYVAEVDALISLFTGDFERVVERIEPFLEDSSLYRGYVFHNALGSSYFHMGEFESSVDVLTTGITQGGPFGPAPFAYLMAAHHRLGNKVEASELAKKFSETWPQTQLLRIFYRAFVDKEYAEELEKGMVGAGWQPSE